MAIGDVKDLIVRFFAENWEAVKEKIDSIPDHKTVKIDVDTSGLDRLRSMFSDGGFLSKLLFQGFGKLNLPGFLPNLPSFFTSLPGLAAIAAAAATAVAAIDMLVSGFAAAAAGLGAFALLARPTFTALSTGLTALSTATSNYQAASQTLDIAIRKSPADWKAYQATIHGLEPDLQNAARLLTNQNVVWQALSPSMQKSVVALSNNKDALRLLLPDQRKALDALLAERTAWDSLSPAQQRAADSLNKLGNSYQKIVAAFQPTVLKLFNEALSVATHLLPALAPMATAFANALGPLLQKLDKFVQSTGFHDWLKQFTSLIGPATSAIGNGIGRMVSDFGKLLTIFSGKDVARAITVTFNIIDGAIRGVGAVINWLKGAWDAFTQKDVPALEHAFLNVEHAIGNVIHAFDNIDHALGNVNHAVANAAHAWDNFKHAVAVAVQDIWNTITTILSPGRLASFLVNSGRAIISGLIAGIKSAVGGLQSVLSWVTSLIPSWKGPLDKDRMLLFPNGQAIMGGLMGGIGSQVPALNRQLTGITTGIGGSVRGHGIGAGGGITINVTVSPGTSPNETARAIQKMLLQLKRTNGGAALGLA